MHPHGANWVGADITAEQIAFAKRLAAGRGLNRISAQAVGGAVGRNGISIIVPCHRVVSSNGSLTGYAGGLARKRRLLDLEGVDMSRLFLPAETL